MLNRDMRETVWETNCKELISKNKPPANAIAINRPDGTPYAHVWHDCKVNRVCMMFSNMSGISTQWAAAALPDLITAFESLQAAIEQKKVAVVNKK